MKKCVYKPDKPLSSSPGRWVLDYAEDYQFLTTVFENLKLKPEGDFNWENVVALIDGNKKFLTINSHRSADWQQANQAVEDMIR